jgi:hypothetical protein
MYFPILVNLLVFCRSLFVLFHSIIILSVLRFMSSDYLFGIFKLFSYKPRCLGYRAGTKGLISSGPGWLNELGSWIYLATHTSLSPTRRGFAPAFVNYKKGCTRLTAASDKVYQLLVYGRWFSPGTPASSTTKTGRHDIAEILPKVALNTINQIKSNMVYSRLMNVPYYHHGT